MMCTCGHVRSAHSETESCRMCNCSCFIDKEMLERWNKTAERLGRVEARLNALVGRLDVMQDSISELRRAVQ